MRRRGSARWRDSSRSRRPQATRQNRYSIRRGYRPHGYDVGKRRGQYQACTPAADYGANDLFASFGHTVPIISTKRGQWQIGPIVHVADGVVGPSVSDCDRIANGVAPDFNSTIFQNFGVGGDEVLILTGDGETDRLRDIKGAPATVNMRKAECDLAVNFFHRLITRTLVGDVNVILLGQ